MTRNFGPCPICTAVASAMTSLSLVERSACVVDARAAREAPLTAIAPLPCCGDARR